MRAVQRWGILGCLGWWTACTDAGGGASSTQPGSDATATDTGGTVDPDASGDMPTGAGPQGDGSGPGSATDSTAGDTTQPADTGDTAPTGDDTGEPGELGGPFLRGINLGYRNPNWGDPDMGWLAGQAGSNSARLSLPETHVEKWGYEIEVGDMMAYLGDGLSHHIAFLIEPIAAHSTAPDGTPDWQLAHHIPKKSHMV